MKTFSEAPRSRGRPRAFDRDAALDVALRLFWRHGYDATSVADLSAAMGIAPASLYAAFGDKEALFGEVLALYGSGPARYAADALGRESLKDALIALVRGAAEAFSREGWPHGCLATLGDAGLGPKSAEIGLRMAAGRAMFRRMIEDRIRRAADFGEVAQDVDCGTIADSVIQILFGVAVHARDGVSTDRLAKAGEVALDGVLARLRLA